MADTSVARVALGAATLNRKWFIDVDSTPSATATWLGVFGVTEFKPATDAVTQDTSDFSSGYKSETVTALGWSVEFKLSRKVTAASATAYDPGQEFLRLLGMEMGIANRAHIRWYEMNGSTGPKIEAYDGYASVSWSDEGGDFSKASEVTVKLTGQGARNTITHPAAA